MTFVLTLLAMALTSVGGAEPLRESIYTQTKSAEKPKSEQSSTESIDDLNLMSTDHQQVEKPKSPYYPYHQSLSLRVLTIRSSEDEHPALMGIGVTYLWPRYQAPQAEFGADVVTEKGGHLNAGVRYILHRQELGRPYFLFGVTHQVVADDGLATFTEPENYYSRVAAGTEIVTRLPASIRLDFEYLIGTKRQMFVLALGYSWGW